MDQSILRAYDIRGLVGSTLGLEDAFAIGKAFATILTFRFGERPKLCVAYDGRLSSPELEAELVRGMLSAGADVTRIGLGPSPMLYFAVHVLGSDGGVAVLVQTGEDGREGDVCRGLVYRDDQVIEVDGVVGCIDDAIAIAVGGQLGGGSEG